MAELQTGRNSPHNLGAVGRHGVPMPRSDAEGNVPPASPGLPAPPDRGQEARPADDGEGIPQTYDIALEREVRPTDSNRRMEEPPPSAEARPVDLEPLAGSVAETGKIQLAPGAGDRRDAQNGDWVMGAVGSSMPAPVQTAPRGPWFRVVLLLLMLQVLTAVALWTPARLQAVAASTMKLLLPTDIAESRTAAGPGPLVGQLDVTSSPSGIELFVDGERHGVTPALLILHAGTHEVTLVSSIGTVRRKVRVRPGHRTLFSEAIFPGSLVVSSAVEVEVRINGNAVGASGGHELVLAPGSYQLELLMLDGGARTTHTVEIFPGQVTTLDVGEARGNDD